MAASFAKQTVTREIVDTSNSVKNQAKSVIDNFEQGFNNQSNLKTPRTRTNIPEVSPVFEVPEVSSTSGPQASIRDRVRDNPALAASLLGGLDNIGFV